ncbi:hypothetical protein BKA67DRAFT_574178 [Truncatella angustata]|uniref:Chromo domain-containing protein n=1 Tax=Truncatella angustata TaxID=152316 RepID=A0A9P8UE46_9PEZI|nr:uncharacterized protein BKA67DRAFT_574178 [Truncatella angustata]KAH6648257.1 hypothetical protein BKA67DRAFT_574178 [Truncatella angustata]
MDAQGYVEVEDGVEGNAAYQQPYNQSTNAQSAGHSPSRKTDKSSRPVAATFSPQLQVHIKSLKPVLGQAASAGGFTPAARSAGRWASPSPSPFHQAAAGSQTPSVQDLARNASLKPSRKRKRKEPSEHQGPLEEPVWVVKRLEEDQIVDDHGQVQRYFKVRWAGDWPPDQNPTWEPESNLPPKLIKDYLKRNAADAKSSKMKAEELKKRPAVPLTRKYSSVAEAFEGEVEDELHHDASNYSDHVDLDMDADMEEKLLVEESERTAELAQSHPPARTNLPYFQGLRPFAEYTGSGNRYGQPKTNSDPYL